jgi:hypothetical protein
MIIAEVLINVSQKRNNKYFLENSGKKAFEMKEDLPCLKQI